MTKQGGIEPRVFPFGCEEGVGSENHASLAKSFLFSLTVSTYLFIYLSIYLTLRT